MDTLLMIGMLLGIIVPMGFIKPPFSPYYERIENKYYLDFLM